MSDPSLIIQPHGQEQEQQQQQHSGTDLDNPAQTLTQTTMTETEEQEDMVREDPIQEEIVGTVDMENPETAGAGDLRLEHSEELERERGPATETERTLNDDEGVFSQAGQHEAEAEASQSQSPFPSNTDPANEAICLASQQHQQQQQQRIVQEDSLHSSSSQSLDHSHAHAPAHTHVLSQLTPEQAAAAQLLRDQGRTRKQNVACDGCRGRKVKCNRLPGSERCVNCKAKNLDCTFHYVTSISSARRSNKSEGGGGGVSSRSVGGGAAGSVGGGGVGSPRSATGTGTGEEGSGTDGARQLTPAVAAEGALVGGASSVGQTQSKRTAEDNNGLSDAAGLRGEGSGSVSVVPAATPKVASKRGRPSKRMKYSLGEQSHPLPDLSQVHGRDQEAVAKMRALLAFLFWPDVIRDTSTGYRDWIAGPNEQGWPKAPTFEASPNQTHKKLYDEEARIDLASDLIETYFQIVHIRFPLLDPIIFRKQFHDPAGSHGPPLAGLIATVLAWGAKFSEHPLITQDREECSRVLKNGRKRSRLAQMMSCRAQQILETDKVARLATLESLQTCFLMAVLQGDGIAHPRSMCPTWYKLAIIQAQFLGYNKKKVLQQFKDSRTRTSAAFCWWIVSWSDALIGVMHRHRPSVADDDEDIEAIDSWRPGDGALVASTAGVDEYVTYHGSLTALSRVSRYISNAFWKPRNERQGLPLMALRTAADMLSGWRDEYLQVVGVPTVWPSSWDFVAAVTACASDANYHSIWIIIAQTIREYGILELRQIESGNFPYASPAEMDAIRASAEKLKDRIFQEALHGALRISALAGVLTANSYLRLDPSILCSQIYEAGIYLASLGREEVQACVSGLRQYGLAYEEAFDRMEDIEAAMAEYSNHTSQRAEQAAVFGGNGTVNGGYVPKHDGPSGGDGMMANYSTRDGAEFPYVMSDHASSNVPPPPALLDFQPFPSTRPTSSNPQGVYYGRG